jgi:hypothetical protein
MRFARLMLCAFGLLACGARADAQVLYGATSAGGASGTIINGELYRLSPANGSIVQDVGPLNDGLGTNYPVTGLAFHPTTGLLYGSTGNSNPAVAAELITINPATGLVTVVGPYNVGNAGKPATMADIAFDAAGNLFGVGSVGGPQLYSINIATGKATLVGTGTGLTSTGGGGLAISPTGTYFGTPTTSRFGTYDPTTGAFTNITNPVKPAGAGYGALAFDPSGTLYGLNVGTGAPATTHLVTMTAAGAVTDLGASVLGLDAIAFQSTPVPEPGTLALLAGPVAVGLFRKLRRRA